MGSTMLVLGWMAAPVRKAWTRMGQARTQARLEGIRALASAGNRIHKLEAAGQAAWAPTATKAQPRRVRVLRIVDAGGPASAAGRLVVSGRLADVCAELDRLVALEAAAA